MTLNITDLLADEAKVVVEYGGTQCLVTYRPGTITANKMRDLTKMIEDDDVDPLVDMMVELIVDWDIKEGTKKYAVSTENMGRLPLSLVREIFQAIVMDGGEGEAVRS